MRVDGSAVGSGAAEAGAKARLARQPVPARRIGVLSNLRAGRNAVRASEMLAVLGEHPDVVHVQTGGGEDVAEILRQFAEREVDLLVVNGGDGTLQQALTALLTLPLFPQLPLIAPLRGGRTNMSAIDMGAQPSPALAVRAVIDAARQGRLHERTVERAVLRIEMVQDRMVQYGMFCGVGVIHRAVELVHRAFPAGPRSRGALGAGALTALLVARAALRSASGILAPDRMHIVLDGDRVPHQTFQLAITTTLDRLFLGLQPFWGREVGSVKVTTVALEARRKWARALGILHGRPSPAATPAAGYTSRNVRCAEITLDCGLCVDGELFGPRRERLVRIEADQRIRFVRA